MRKSHLGAFAWEGHAEGIWETRRSRSRTLPGTSPEGLAPKEDWVAPTDASTGSRVDDVRLLKSPVSESE